MSETPKRFSQLLQDEISQPSPKGENILPMRDRLRTFVGNIRRKFGWSTPNTRVIPPTDFQQREEDAIDDAIVALMHRYRQKLMSSHVTERAAYQVLNQVRDWATMKYRENNRLVNYQDDDVESYAPAVFHASAENKLEDFERLHTLGVVDVVEYYFLFAAYHGETTKYAAQLIQIQETTGRKILERARDKVQAYLDELDAGTPPTPKPTQERRTSRQVDQDLLMNAIRHILGRAV